MVESQSEIVKRKGVGRVLVLVAEVLWADLVSKVVAGDQRQMVVSGEQAAWVG